MKIRVSCDIPTRVFLHIVIMSYRVSNKKLLKLLARVQERVC